MSFRKRMSRGRSRRLFSRTARARRSNYKRRMARGGGRK